jgi:hypothetical protein
MRGRKPKYTTDEERAEARRQASQRYRDKRAAELDEAKLRIEELEAELELLRKSNDAQSGDELPGTCNLI